MHRGCCTKEAGEEDEDRYDQELYSDAVQFIPTATILQPCWVGLVGVDARNAVVDGNERGHGKDDDDCPEDGCQGDEQAGAAEYGAMLVGGTQDEKKSESVPEGHRFAEDFCERLRYLGVGVIVQLSKLRVDEGRDGDLVTCHGC